MPGGVAPKFGCLKRCRATRGVAATVAGLALHCATKFGGGFGFFVLVLVLF